jgi:hypothetical protein
MSYNAKAVKIYNATSSLVRFEYIKWNIIFCFETLYPTMYILATTLVV